MILRTLCEQILKMGKSIVVSFIDYTVSHKFIDRTLQKAGVTNKVRAMFRAVYSAASAFTTVTSPDGGMVKSNSFQIRRGVVQGDVTSPLYFIMALDTTLFDNR